LRLALGGITGVSPGLRACQSAARILVKMFRAAMQSASPVRSRAIHRNIASCASPIVLTTGGTSAGGASRIDANRRNAGFRDQTFDPLRHTVGRSINSLRASKVFLYRIMFSDRRYHWHTPLTWTPGVAISRHKLHIKITAPGSSPGASSPVE